MLPMKNWITPRTLLVTAVIIIIGLLVWWFFNIVAYILIASVLSLIARPFVHLLGRIRIGKWRIPVSIRALITLILIWVVFFGFLRLYIPLITAQVQELSNIETESVIRELEKPLERLENWYNNLDIGRNQEFSIEEALEERIAAVLNIHVITDMVTGLASLMGTLAWAIFAISFITFFLLREEFLLFDYLVTFFSEEREESLRHAFESVKHLLRRYFVGVLLQMTGILIIVTAGMTIVGVGFRHGLVIGLLAAILNIIPYLGPWIGAAIGVTLGLASQLPMDITTEIWPMAGYLTLVFVIAQLTDNAVFQPVIFGTSVYAHPIEIFLVILIAGSMAGIAGMILAIPTYTVIRVFAKEFFNKFRVVQKLTDKI
jgi:predicted PurR-regulated permease PerM